MIVKFISKRIKTKEDIFSAMTVTEELANEQEFSIHDVIKMRLATEEACTNSYEYCRAKGMSYFLIKWSATPSLIEITVRQKGKASFPLIEQADVNTGLRGRGIALMVHLMDKVEIRRRKNCVELYMNKWKGE
ncbi:hypothetical protein A8F95_14665 [Bacillus wudalianchiensis]|uniref:Histidine kinase/HSP90-like ATPase domain-containing protein n=1 Tax=Pseudobacillus wudalianchiensis TaxID=1743143 RepID=A0A1B9ADN7_9BACI|nr:hypothetical protein A8F95_14665 [Bacillus wudalianchiensis]